MSGIGPAPVGPMAIKDVCDSSFGRRTAAGLGLGSRSLFDQWCEPVEWAGDVYGWFTEGFDTADLKEAKALLDELT